MSINHSAKLVTDGLVMYYDMSNTKKSWKGAPTTNVLVDTGDLSTGNWGYTLFGNWPATGAVANVATAPDGTLTATRLSASGYSRFQRYTVSANQVYTFSMWVRNVNMPGAISLQLATGLNGTLVSYGYATGVNLTANWAVYSYTITIPASGVNQLEVGLNVNANSYNSNIFCDVWHPQLEAQSFATPFVNGTRSNAQVLVDLTGNNTITPTNLNSTSYLDNTCITLDGNNQYLYTSGNSYWNAWSPDGTNGNASMTIELIFNSSDTGGLLISRPWNGNGQYNYTMSNAGFGLHSNASGANLAYSSICTGATVHMVWWMNSTQYGVYKNGVEYVAATNHGLSGNGGSGGTNAFGTLFGSLYPYGEGWGGNTGFSIAGKYYLAKIYNRALSAAEVAQNFQALRGRYSL